MIRKIGLAAIEHNKLLLVRKKGLSQLIMPGGKIEPGESHEGCLRRELLEELDVKIEDLKFLGKFEAISADSIETVSIELYSGKLKGTLKAKNEIESYVWASVDDWNFSPIVKNKIVPFLVNKGLLKP